jgi:hypothetical protein
LGSDIFLGSRLFFDFLKYFGAVKTSIWQNRVSVCGKRAVGSFALFNGRVALEHTKLTSCSKTNEHAQLFFSTFGEFERGLKRCVYDFSGTQYFDFEFCVHFFDIPP